VARNGALWLMGCLHKQLRKKESAAGGCGNRRSAADPSRRKRILTAQAAHRSRRAHFERCLDRVEDTTRAALL
jgi:hypothetical protein